MWGIRKIKAQNGSIYGITPTYVGNTVDDLPDIFDIEDHPHLCGEYERMGERTMTEVGSPPPMWGIRN